MLRTAINSFLARARGSDIVLAVFVLAITAMLLIPLPTILLDFLLVINISFSLLLLLVGLYMPNALALLAFPSLLLLTTLFRLSLNVASTRLILSQGDAGTVISAFGTFLIRGEVIVGAIIFTIITIVNFIVITKGSSRVSEVAARFALDALPGKQMAIDSELRGGLINAEEARQKRDDLRKESQLYGAMDGAMKFVQGDVIAGFFIILTNIIGGMYQGVSGGMSFSAAIDRYTILTVGDGLVSQIPALLISICAGIVVTRVSSGENTTLGKEMGDQLFARPGTVLFSGVLLLFIGLLPGLPKLPFLTVGALICAGGFLLNRSATNRLPALLGAPQNTTFHNALLADESGANPDSALVLLLDGGLLYKLYKGRAIQYQSWWKQFQADYFQETGMVLPELQTAPDDLLPPGGYALFIAGSLAEQGQLPLDARLVEVNPDSAPLLGIEVLQTARHPLTGSVVCWAPQTAGLKPITEAAQIKTYDYFQYVALRVGAFYQRRPEELITISEIHSQLKQLEKKHPGLVSQILNENVVTVPRLTELLQELAREGLAVKDFKQILEAVAAWCATIGGSALKDDAYDLHELVAFVRYSRRRQLVERALSARRGLRVLTLSGDLEEVFENCIPENQQQQLPLEPSVFDSITGNLQKLLQPVKSKGVASVSILCRSDLRPQVARFLRTSEEFVHLLTFDELDPLVRLETVGIWSV